MPGQSYGLEDGSCSYKDFSGSRNNRFSTPEQAAKNRIQHPSNVLHFFNAPLEVTEDNFYEVSLPPPPPPPGAFWGRIPPVWVFLTQFRPPADLRRAGRQAAVLRQGVFGEE